jgi:tetratricopeptide (TPR) repeat protein
MCAINQGLEVCEEVNFQMKRTGYIGVSLLLIIALAASALPGFGQQLQLKTKPEYDSYMAFYNEKDPVKKAPFGEKFIADFKESDYIPTAHQLLIVAYTDAKNWAKVIETADRAVALPNASNNLKLFSYVNAMSAAQNMNNLDKLISYGDKALAIDPAQLNALLSVSSAVLLKLPADEAGKKTSLDKSEDLAKKALAGIEAMAAKDPATKPQLVPVEGTVHVTLGQVAYYRPDYMKSIQEFEAAIQRTPKDDVAHFYLGLDYQALAAQASRQYADAVNEENKAKAAKAEQSVIDELAARTAGLGGDVQKYRDRAIEELAIATALNGPSSAQAKEALTKLWKTKNNDDVSGLEDFIAKKKQSLGD